MRDLHHQSENLICPPLEHELDGRGSEDPVTPDEPKNALVALHLLGLFEHLGDLRP